MPILVFLFFTFNVYPIIVYSNNKVQDDMAHSKMPAEIDEVQPTAIALPQTDLGCSQNKIKLAPSPPANPYSTPLEKLLQELYSFAPNFKEVFYQKHSDSRSFTLESVELWARFLAAKRQDYLIAFIQDKLRFWIDLHSRDHPCLLHLDMPSIGHDTLANIFTTAIWKRLDAIHTRFPDNTKTLSRLRDWIEDSGADTWSALSNKQPDKAFGFRGTTFAAPGVIVEVGNSQKWEGNEGVKNKAIGFIDDSKGQVNIVLYLSLREKTIAMIGSKHLFEDRPPAKYLDD